jgi:hypothetical protein
MSNEAVRIVTRSTPPILAAFFALSSPALWMSVAGLVLLVIGLLAAKNDIAQARGLDRIVALTKLCFAIPLAVFGAVDNYVAANKTVTFSRLASFNYQKPAL